MARRSRALRELDYEMSPEAEAERRRIAAEIRAENEARCRTHNTGDAGPTSTEYFHPLVRVGVIE